MMKKKLSEEIEDQLILDILDGKYRPGDSLPFERDLATNLNIGRPTLREAIQRLERDGFVTVRKGKATVVNDFWKTGTLNILSKLASFGTHMSEEFIVHLLEFRVAIFPAMVFEAISDNAPLLVGSLAGIDRISDSPEAYANYDWKLQKSLASLSKNPLYTLLLNSFDTVYTSLAAQYFSTDRNRILSKKFYRELMEAAMKREADRGERVSRKMMKESVVLWKNTRIQKGGGI